jgi:uncharacterized protein (TIGR03032 family)
LRQSWPFQELATLAKGIESSDVVVLPPASAHTADGDGSLARGDAGNGHATPARNPPFEVSASRQFTSWLREQRVSLAFTTYQAGMLFFIGSRPDGRLSLFRRALPRCMGMTADGNSIFVSSLYQVWRFENTLEPGKNHEGFDRVYVPQASYVTGDVDAHDMAVDSNGRLIFVNTLFGCLAGLSETYSFLPLWRPPFVSKLAAEDRCHLNGLAMRNGRPAHVTTVSEGDVADGWRDYRRDGGCLIDVAANAIVLRGLSMPHSPRWYRNRLFLHNSGTGDFGWVDLETRAFKPICFLPGYLRGLDFVGDFAIVGLSKPRKNREFNGLALQERLAEKKATPRCAVAIVDLRTGDAVHWLRMDGAVEELYDVAVLPRCGRPMAIGFQTDEIRRALRLPPDRAATHGDEGAGKPEDRLGL